MPAKYKVTLTEDERQALTALASKGKAAARKLVHARILLKADAGPAGPTNNGSARSHLARMLGSVLFQ